MKKHCLRGIAAIAVGAMSLGAVQSASALTVNLYDTGWGPHHLTSGSGTHRGIHFTADTEFTIGQVGVFANLNNSISYSFQLFASDATLIMETAAFSGPISDDPIWNDVSFNFTFEADVDYILILGVETSGSNLPVSHWMPLFDDVAWNDPNSDFSTDYLTINGGRSQPTVNNAYIPQLRFGDVVAVAIPTPAAFGFAGCFSMLLLRRARRTCG